MKRFFIKLALAHGLAFVSIVSVLLAHAAPAAAAYAYNPSDLISDSIFSNSGSMGTGSGGVQAIQAFLSNENSGLKNYSDIENCGSTSGPHYSYYQTYYHCGASEPASQIIYDVAQAYSINPQVILATLQKEQSLVTTPDPTSSQLNCAMGYNSCSGFVGFFTQVDNGTWQFKTYTELMDGNNYWGYTPSSYPCSTATSLYSAGLYPGATVTFSDPGGTPETVTITDSATAALYCYTPYVGPFSLTGYSGSYNFVQSFEQWFGSTVYPFAADVTVNTYSDAARTQELSLSGGLPSNMKIYVTVTATNTGSQSWSNSFTHIATENPNDRSSVFQDTSWLSNNRPAVLQQPAVWTGYNGTFQFSLTTPSTDGTYNEQFGLVADGQTGGWMQDNASFGFDITVSNPYNGVVTQLGTYRDNNYSLPTDIHAMSYGQTAYIAVNVRNTGYQTWSNSFTHLATEGPNDRTSAFQNGAWNSSNRPATLQQSSVAPGQIGTFLFPITAPSIAGTYNEQFGLVADGQTGGWMPSPVFTLSIIVVPPPLDTLYSGMLLYPGQSIQSKNGQYTLAMQPDGNVVIYSTKGAIWGTGTNGRSVAFVAMQPDGNVVIYDTNNRAIWGSGTQGKGIASLVMQNDGNLVMYWPNGQAVWGTGTNGHGPSQVFMQNDGNLVIYDAQGHPTWASGTAGRP